MSPPRLPLVFMKPVTTPACRAPTSRHTAQQALKAKSAVASATASSTALATGDPTAVETSRSSAQAANDSDPSVHRACFRPWVWARRSVYQPPARSAAPASRNGSIEKKPPVIAENPSSRVR